MKQRTKKLLIMQGFLENDAAWAVADNFHHVTIFQEGDPLLA